MEHALKHLSRITWDQVVLILGKIGTVLIDRRFLAAVGTVLFMAFGIPEGQYSDAIAQVGALILSLVTVLSWTVRPPSGLVHKDVVTAANAKTIAKVINSVYTKE